MCLRGDTEAAQRRAEGAFRDFIQHVASHQCGEATLNGHLNTQVKINH